MRRSVTMMYKVAVEPKLHIQKIKDTTVYDKYWYRCLGYLMIYQREAHHRDWKLKGFITPEDLRKLLGATDWQAFTTRGERYFTKFRIVDDEETPPPVLEQEMSRYPRYLERVSDGAELQLNKDGETYSFTESRMKNPHRWTYERLMEDPQTAGAFRVKQKQTAQ